MLRDPRGGHNRKRVNEDFFKVWTPEMAYVLGFMFADGSLIDSNKSSRTYYISLFNNDLNLLTNIKRVLESNHKIYVKPARLVTYKNGKYISNKGYALRIGNKNMYHDLILLGLTHRKSNTMQLPDIKREYFNYFLRGYFDGDGCISWHLSNSRHYPSLRVLFTSGSVDFLDSLSHKLNEHFDLPLGCINHRPDGAYNLVYQGAKAMTLLSFMYRDLRRVPYLEYKHARYVKFQSDLIGPRVKKALVIA